MSNSVKWYKVGSKLSKNRHSIDENGELAIFNLDKQDSGHYLCVHEQKNTKDEEFFNFGQQDKLVRLIIVESKIDLK